MSIRPQPRGTTRKMQEVVEIGSELSTRIKGGIAVMGFVDDETFVVNTKFGKNPHCGCLIHGFHLPKDMAYEQSSSREIRGCDLGATRSSAFSAGREKGPRSDRKAFAIAPRVPRHLPSATRPRFSTARRDSGPIRQPVTWPPKPPAIAPPQLEDGGPGDRQDSVRWLPLLRYWSLTLPTNPRTLAPQMEQDSATLIRRLRKTSLANDRRQIDIKSISCKSAHSWTTRGIFRRPELKNTEHYLM
jgi:hypothetical protein